MTGDPRGSHGLPRARRVPAPPRRQRARPRPAAGRVVRPRPGARGGHRDGERRARPRSARRGSSSPHAGQAGGQGPRRGPARVPARRARVPQRDARSSCRRAASPPPSTSGDYAVTIVRNLPLRRLSVRALAALSRSADGELAAIAAKSLKESRYHLRHAADWTIRFGDGTDESHARAQAALDALWPYTHELFETDPGRDRPSRVTASAWKARRSVSGWLDDRRPPSLAEATLRLPADTAFRSTGKLGRAQRAPGLPADRDAVPAPAASGRDVVTLAAERAARRAPGRSWQASPIRRSRWCRSWTSASCATCAPRAARSK